MKIALDPYMHRSLGLPEIARLAAELDYRYLELSPRDDFLPLFREPMATRESIASLGQALREVGTEVASTMVVYRWASTNPEERAQALDFFRRAAESALRVGCQTINTEFSGDPDRPAESEPAFLRSLEALIPFLEKEGILVDIEPHPGDFVEDNHTAVDLIRRVNSAHIRYLFCAPHSFHMGTDLAEMMRYSAPVLTHVHVADSLNFRAGLRYIVNPPGTSVRVHQHLAIGEGEVDWDIFFGTLAALGFDGILTSCVFAWEDRAMESSRLMRRRLQEYLDRYFRSPTKSTTGGAG
jgi:myo-inositol catabolism protein IolH